MQVTNDKPFAGKDFYFLLEFRRPNEQKNKSVATILDVIKAQQRFVRFYWADKKLCFRLVRNKCRPHNDFVHGKTLFYLYEWDGDLFRIQVKKNNLREYMNSPFNAISLSKVESELPLLCTHTYMRL